MFAKLLYKLLILSANRLADNIDLLGGSEEELQQFTERLEKPVVGYGMKINSTKGKFSSTASSQSHVSTNIRMNGKMLEEVDQFKYFGSTQTKDGTSLKEVKIRLAYAHSAMTRQEVLWKNSYQFSYED